MAEKKGGELGEIKQLVEASIRQTFFDTENPDEMKTNNLIL